MNCAPNVSARDFVFYNRKVGLMRKGKIFLMLAVAVLLLPAASLCPAQEKDDYPTLDRIMSTVQRIEARLDGMYHQFNALEKAIDDIFWFEVLGDTVTIEKVRHYGPPPRNEPNPTARS